MPLEINNLSILNTKAMITKGGKMDLFLRRNWFKLLVIGFIIFLMFKKDFSFQLDLKSPLYENSPEEREQIPVQQPSKKPKEERYTEAAPVPQGERDQQSNIFNLNPISGGKKNTNRLLQEFKQLDEATISAFIGRFGRVAVAERKKFGVPASIILANGLLISSAGTVDMAQSGNNYFGLQCTSDWFGEQGYYSGVCFRHYENAWTSFRDHSLFLTSGRLASLTKHGSDNYEAWAKSLEKEKFYTEKNTHKSIISIIRQYQLDRFDEN